MVESEIEKEQIQKFNKKWQGKELLFCTALYNNLTFWEDKVVYCCSNTQDPQNGPIVYDDQLDKFNFSRLIKKLDETIEQNQTLKGPCNGCERLQKQLVPEYKKEGAIKALTITNFTRCNSKCIYCNIWHKNKSLYYPVLPVIEQLIAEKMIYNSCMFFWGGGEPTIYEEFENTANYFISNNYQQIVNSTGLIFSDVIFKGLSKDLIKLQISPDSGTPETYQKIKGQNGFDRVWENIKKYCQYNMNVKVKYIVFALNNNTDDIKKFIEKCIHSNVKIIEISCEWRTIWGYDNTWEYGSLTEKEINSAALLLKLAEQNNMYVEISSIWGAENTMKIKERAKSVDSNIYALTV